VDAPSNLLAVRQAVRADGADGGGDGANGPGRAIEIDYLSGSRDELTTRIVEPVQVITIDGHWYLDAYCHRAGDMRRFRVDRILAVRDVERPPGPAVVRDRPLEEMFVPGPGAVEVHLRLGPGAQWVPESVPVRGVVRDAAGMVTDVVLDVSGMAWFERLLLQLGPDATVVSPPSLTGLAADAARRVLVRYR
jgi:proteasome accessory factor C